MDINIKISSIDKVIDIVGNFSEPYQKQLSNKINNKILKENIDLSKNYSQNDILKGLLFQISKDGNFSENQSELLNLILKEDIEEKIKNKINLNDIGIKALKFIPEELSTSNTVSEEFKSNFKNKAKFISDEDVQLKWAQVLANEIIKPGSFSLKTLNILENLSKNDIELFTRVCQYSTNGGIYFYDELIWNSNLNISFENLTHLAYLGLISSDFNTAKIFNINENQTNKSFLNFINNKIIYMFIFTEQGKYTIPTILLTQAGIELLKFVEINYSQEYIEVCIDKFKSISSAYKITLAKVEKIVGGKIFYGNTSDL